MPCNIFCPRFAEKTVQHMLESFYSDRQSVQILRDADVVRPWKQLDLAIQIESLQSNTLTLRVVVLIDSGCTMSMIDNEYALVNGIKLFPLTKPIRVLNADGSENCKGLITHYAKIWIMIGEHIEVCPLLSAQLGADEPIFLSHNWLTHHNPNIDWRRGSVAFSRCPESCGLSENADASEDPWEGQGVKDEDHIFAFNAEGYLKECASFELLCLVQLCQSLAPNDAVKQRQKFEDSIPSKYHLYWDVFLKAVFDCLPFKRPWDCAIKLTKDFKPVRKKLYPLSKVKNEQLDMFIDEHVATGCIRPSISPMASPFFFIKKKDGTLWPVQDYRKLNDMMIKNRYLLPLIQEMIDKLQHARYFTTLDVRWGYNNVRIKEGDEWKAAFVTNRGLYKPLVMFFGLTNSPATFQAMMNKLFHNLISTGKVVIYLDNILIFTEDLDEHCKPVRQVLEVFRSNNLSLKIEKCEFEKTQVKYLGLIVRDGETCMDPAKVGAVANWPEPENKKELQSFLGFCNYYRRFIKDFSEIAHPLHDLTKWDVPFSWGVQHQHSFKMLKAAIISDPILTISHDNAPWRVESDCSDHALGGILSQEVDGKWLTVAFLSKLLSSAERNYKVYNKELLAIMSCLEEWCLYLLGTKDAFEI
jgi:hypothetical protein